MPGVSPTDATVEDDLDVVRSAEIEVVGHQGFEETTGMSGCVEHDGAGDLDLPHGGFPPVACVPILGRERQGETRQPAFDEHSYRPRTKSITDLLHGVGFSYTEANQGLLPRRKTHWSTEESGVVIKGNADDDAAPADARR